MTVLTTSLIVISVLSFLALSIHKAAADSVVDDVTITVPVSCNLDSTLETAHTETINNGTYAENIGTTTLKAYCNDKNGFSIYAAGYTGEEIGGTNSTKLVSTTTGIAGIDTGTAISGNTSAWAMKLTTNTSATYPIEILSDTNGTYSDYHIVPEQYVKVATRLASTDIGAAAVGSTLTTTYRAYISPTQPAGTYAGKVIYTLVHPSLAPTPVVCNPSGTTIGTNTSTDIKCMQDISSANKSTILTSMTEGTQYTLADKRDNKTYTVSKLADGNIWMTQNLDLDLDAGITYTNLDTDLGWNSSTNTYDAASWSPERSTYTTGTTTWGLYNTTTSTHDDFYHPESYDPGDLYWNGTLVNYGDWDAYYSSCTYDENTWLYSNCDESLNPIAAYTTISGTPTAQYHLGNYYNWSAAIASNDSSSYGVYDEETGSYTNTQTNQSICPAGWTLPIGGYFDSNTPNKSFQYLIEQYGWNDNDYMLGNDQKIWNSPIYLGLSGSWYGMLKNVGLEVILWSSTAYNGEGAYVLMAGSDGAGPDSTIYRNGGSVVRCVAR